MSLDLFSEPYRPEGNIDARAASRALTQPASLDTWDVLLRESLQNSWDARLPGATVHYRVDAFEPDETQLAALTDEVFCQLPPAASLDGYNPAVPTSALVITDSGTRGLCGPTRADRTQTDHDDFVDFIRNVGRAETKALGGGTYGFGKGALYDASFGSTLVVFTRTTDHGRPVCRLMAIRLGSSYDHGPFRYTGRQWWGVADPVTGAEPLTGAPAVGLADRLGIDLIPSGQTGTALMILDPIARTEDESLGQIVGRLATAALFWAWPHMLDREDGGPTITFEFNEPGGPVPVPSPTEHPALRDYATAYLRATALQGGGPAQGGWPWQDTEIRAGHGQRNLLGALSYRRHLPGQIPEHRPQEPDVTNHVALMRDPRFVVRYRDAPRDPAGGGVSAVFIADRTQNDQFALSEPVAHDEWIPANVPRAKYERNNVKQALNHIDEALRPPPLVLPGADGAVVSGGLVALAASLGTLLDGQVAGTDTRLPRPDSSGRRAAAPGFGAPLAPVGETGTGPQNAGGFGDGRPADGESPGGGATPGTATELGGRGFGRVGTGSARLSGQPVLRMHRAEPAAAFPVALTVGRSARLFVTAAARVLVDGGSERPDEAPFGAPVPTVLGWSAPDAAGPNPGVDPATLIIDEEGSHNLWLWVSQPADTAVTVTVTRTVEAA